MKKYCFYQISQIRNIIFGLATLLIIVFHSNKLNEASSVDLVNRIFNIPLTYGSIGVDIFLLLSGVGLYFSFSSNEDVKEFYYRRAVRLLPALLIVSLVFSIIGVILGEFNILQGVLSVLLLSFWIYGDRTFWYFSLLLVLYAVYPIVYRILKKYKFRGLVFLILIWSLAIIGLFKLNHDAFLIYEIALTRVYVFLIGAWIGEYIKNKKELNYYVVLFSSVIMILLFSIIILLNSDRLNEHVYILRLLYCPLSVALVIFLSIVIPKKESFINTVLIWYGGLSCEMYLLYERFIRYPFSIILNYFSFREFLYLYYLIAFILTSVFAYILSKICSVIQDAIYKRCNKSEA